MEHRMLDDPTGNVQPRMSEGPLSPQVRRGALNLEDSSASRTISGEPVALQIGASGLYLTPCSRFTGSRVKPLRFNLHVVFMYSTFNIILLEINK